MDLERELLKAQHICNYNASRCESLQIKEAEVQDSNL